MLNFNTKKSNYSCEQHVAFSGFESDYFPDFDLSIK